MTTGFSFAVSRSGFSLVELSIVLVILGLLTGGILTGQNLIRAAELRAATAEFQQYQSSIETFRSTYLALPGDMRNAEDFWGTMSSGTCPNATGGVGSETCNGDGNGVLTDAAANGQTGEWFTFWQHLANAGMISGTYTGISGPGATSGTHMVVGENIPASKITNAGWSALERQFSSTHFNLRDTNTLQIGGQSSNGTNGISVLKPEEAWNIDKKLDDGRPAYGTVISFKWENCTTATDRDELISEYNLSSNSINCVLIFRDIF